MKNSILYYSIGALLYCPANNESIVDSIINQRFGDNFSLALCLEDTIKDDFVLEAEVTLVNTITEINETKKKPNFYLPKIFIRVRSADQIKTLTKRLQKSLNIITGFIAPKFSLDNADGYINTIIEINKKSPKPIYIMPIFESPTIINLQNRTTILYSLKEKLDKIEELVLNIRVGGNDLCHMFGFRRHSNESIHSIKPISNILSDIITVFGMDYVVSGPVWEYYNGYNWDTGLINELEEDRLCGFVGKTVIHPNQIKLVNNAYKVTQADLDDAQSILNWDKNSHSLVSGNLSKERMNEFKTHSNWAYNMIMLAEVFGVK